MERVLVAVLGISAFLSMAPGGSSWIDDRGAILRDLSSRLTQLLNPITQEPEEVLIQYVDRVLEIYDEESKTTTLSLVLNDVIGNVGGIPIRPFDVPSLVRDYSDDLNVPGIEALSRLKERIGSDEYSLNFLRQSILNAHYFGLEAAELLGERARGELKNGKAGPYLELFSTLSLSPTDDRAVQYVLDITLAHMGELLEMRCAMAVARRKLGRV